MISLKSGLERRLGKRQFRNLIGISFVEMPEKRGKQMESPLRIVSENLPRRMIGASAKKQN